MIFSPHACWCEPLYSPSFSIRRFTIFLLRPYSFLQYENNSIFLVNFICVLPMNKWYCNFGYFLLKDVSPSLQQYASPHFSIYKSVETQPLAPGLDLHNTVLFQLWYCMSLQMILPHSSKIDFCVFQIHMLSMGFLCRTNIKYFVC